METPPLAVTAIGLVSSLGLEVTTACAAARAGLSRPSLLDGFVTPPATEDPVPAVGHPIGPFTRGFDGAGRLLRVAELGARSLAASAPAEVLARARWVVAAPEGLPVEPPYPDDDPDEVDPDEVPEADPVAAEVALAAHRLGDALAAGVGMPVSPERLTLFEGRAGFALGLRLALDRLRVGEACVVGAFDSLIRSSVVGRLAEHERLDQSGPTPGLAPGEAAVFLLLERDTSGTCVGLVRDAAVADEAAHLYAGRPPTGRALAALAQSLAGATSPWLLSDCNGEPFRSSEWGHALSQAPSLREGLEAATYPALAFGDTGAASGALGVAVAFRAFARGYAPAPTALVLGAEATARRSAVLVSAL